MRISRRRWPGVAARGRRHAEHARSDTRLPGVHLRLRADRRPRRGDLPSGRSRRSRRPARCPARRGPAGSVPTARPTPASATPKSGRPIPARVYVRGEDRLLAPFPETEARRPRARPLHPDDRAPRPAVADPRTARRARSWTGRREARRWASADPSTASRSSDRRRRPDDLARQPRDGARGFRSPIEAAVPIEGSSWVAVRCFEGRPDRRIRFAHTGPTATRCPRAAAASPEGRGWPTTGPARGPGRTPERETPGPACAVGEWSMAFPRHPDRTWPSSRPPDRSLTKGSRGSAGRSRSPAACGRGLRAGAGRGRAGAAPWRGCR